MKNKKINIIILIFALSLVLYFTLKDNLEGVIKELSNINIFIFVISILTYMLSLVFKSISLHIFIKENGSKKYKFKNTFALTLIGQFLNGITPFQSGGQPFQIYLLKKEGFRISDTSCAMIKDFISYQIALIIMGVLALLINLKLKIINLNLLIFIGFMINIVVLIVLFLSVFAKKTIMKLADKLMILLIKIKVIKYEDTFRKKVIDGLNNFYEGGIELKNDKTKLMISVLTNIMNLSLLYIIPFIIFKSANCNNVTILGSLSLTAFVMLIGNFIPIPGATGGIEYGFISFFGAYKINSVLLSSCMLLWRFTTYFFGMLVGFIVLIWKEGFKKNENRTFY